MTRFSGRLVLGMTIVTAGILSPALGLIQSPGFQFDRAFAEASDRDEKEAFEAAKELGTADAWNAFLASYSNGFLPDLARAYLKKLGNQPQADTRPAQADTRPPDDFPMPAGSWGGIVRKGPGPNYSKVDSLKEGQPVTLLARTEVIEDGFPWFKIAYEGDGSGYQWGGILCSVDGARADLFKTCPAASASRETYKPERRETTTREKREADRPAKRQTETREAPRGCASGKVRIDGKCIEKGAASGYCGPGYRPQGGKCVQGYQAPKANTPLSSEQNKAVQKGCPKGQVYNSAEGCHEDD